MHGIKQKARGNQGSLHLVNVSWFYVFKRPAVRRWTGFNVK